MDMIIVGCNYPTKRETNSANHKEDGDWGMKFTVIDVKLLNSTDSECGEYCNETVGGGDC